MAPRKKKTPVSGPPRTTRSSAPAHIDVGKPPSSAAESSTIPPLQKLRIPSRSAITSHSMTPTVSSTPTATQAPSPTGSSDSSPAITPPPKVKITQIEIDAAVNALMGRGGSRTVAVLKDLTESEPSDSEVEIVAPLSPTHRRKDKRKRGASDVSRDQASPDEAPGSGGISEEDQMEGDEEDAEEEGDDAENEEEEEEEEEEVTEEEIEGMAPNSNRNFHWSIANIFSLQR